MEEIRFVAPTEGGFAFDGEIQPGCSRWYHGTSICLAAHIEEFGFSQKARILSETERSLLLKYWNRLPSRREPLDCIVQERVSEEFQDS